MYFHIFFLKCYNNHNSFATLEILACIETLYNVTVFCVLRGRCGPRDRLDLQLPMQSVPLTTKDVWLNPSHGEVYGDKVAAAGRWLALDTLVSSANKTDPNAITETLLKVAFNTVTPIPNSV